MTDAPSVHMLCGVCHKPTTRTTSTVVPRVRRATEGRQAGKLVRTGDTTRYCDSCLAAAKK